MGHRKLTQHFLPLSHQLTTLYWSDSSTNKTHFPLWRREISSGFRENLWEILIQLHEKKNSHLRNTSGLEPLVEEWEDQYLPPAHQLCEMKCADTAGEGSSSQKWFWNTNTIISALLVSNTTHTLHSWAVGMHKGCTGTPRPRAQQWERSSCWMKIFFQAKQPKTNNSVPALMSFYSILSKLL